MFWRKLFWFCFFISGALITAPNIVDIIDIIVEREEREEREREFNKGAVTLIPAPANIDNCSERIVYGFDYGVATAVTVTTIGFDSETLDGVFFATFMGDIGYDIEAP